MRRVVVGHVPKRNNDLVIATFNPIPQGPIDFMDIRNVLDDFLRNHKRMGYQSMQPCPHGQAFVRLNCLFEKDLLIDNSPHQYGDGTISFVEHNKSWNNRTAVMTHEAWLMLLGLDLDLWTQPLLEKAVSSFGQLMLWEEDYFHLARALVKVRVSELDEIPWFFVFTEGTNFDSDGWTVQCEVLHTRMIGGAAQDEDLPPGDDDFNPNAFFYHGFGQFGQGPPPPPEDPPAPFILENLQAMGWGAWPHQAVQDLDGNLHQQLNEEIPPPLVPLQPQQVIGNEPAPVNVQQIVLPPVEEVIQVLNADLVDGPPPLVEGQVLAMDDNTDEDDDFQQPPLPIPPVPVQIPNFPDLQHMPPLQVEEVPLQDLVAFDDLQPQFDLQQQNDIFDLGNIQLGFVETFVPPVDPVLALPSQSPSAAAVRCWANHFSLVDRSLPTVTIPTQWVDFFTLLLLKPGSFEWAQSFLQSPAWTALNQLFKGNSLDFTLPNSPPSVVISEFSCTDPPVPACLDSLEVDSEEEPSLTEPSLAAMMNPNQSELLETTSRTHGVADNIMHLVDLNPVDMVTPPPAAPLKSVPRGKRGKDLHISDTNVRRSGRLHSKTLGFKSSPCRDKNCVGCSANPPSLSSSVVRELGSTFCQLDASSLTDDHLNAKPGKPSTVGQSKHKKTKKSEGDRDGANTSKFKK
jgi:hypothetical protein